MGPTVLRSALPSQGRVSVRACTIAQPSIGSVASQIGPVQFRRGSWRSALQANTASGTATKQATNRRFRGSACAGSESAAEAADQRRVHSSGSASSGSGVATSSMFSSSTCS